MINLREFIIEDVRCFQGSHRADIRPITFLVGENSTGKTSFLGSYRALFQIMGAGITFPFPGMRDNPNFNLEPFHMGAFRDIVRHRRGQFNKPDTFILGCSISDGNKKYDMLFTFVEEGSEPSISSLRFNFSPQSYLDIKFQSSKKGILKIPDHTIEFRVPLLSHLAFVSFLLRHSDVKDWTDLFNISEEDAKVLNEFIQKEFNTKSTKKNTQSRKNYPSMYPVLGLEESIAPLRSKPKRTYDPITESPTAYY